LRLLKQVNLAKAKPSLGQNDWMPLCSKQGGIGITLINTGIYVFGTPLVNREDAAVVADFDPKWIQISKVFVPRNLIHSQPDLIKFFRRPNEI